MLKTSNDTSDSSPTQSVWQQVLAHEDVIAMSHVNNRASAQVSTARLYKMIAENMCHALDGREYVGVVNGVFMPLTLVTEMKPFMQLGESLGRFIVQMILSKNSSKIKLASICVATKGGKDIDITTPKARSALQSAVLKGVMDSLQSTCNDGTEVKYSYLNSNLLAMSSGIDVHFGELVGENSHLNNAVTVEIKTKCGDKFLVMGSVFGEEPRIVQVDEYSDFPAFKPQGTLLFFNNEDRPGAIAGILKELSESKINVASLGLARQSNLSKALGILGLDTDPSNETITNLKELPGIENVRIARLHS